MTSLSLESIANWFAIASVAAATVQAFFALAFERLLKRTPPLILPVENYPEAAILLPLRGADARLEETLQRLIDQDHPNYTIRVVVDNPSDPAFDVACQVSNQPQGHRLKITTLENRRRTCGLQCSALVEAVEGLEDSVVDVATIDGDVLAHKSWLRELLAPLQDPSVGATFGNRWFLAHRDSWGSIVRHLWNAAAIVPMWIFGIPWGGTFAIKKKWLIETGLLERWSRGMVHDAPAPGLLKEKGLQLRFIPSLMMPIGESCGLGFCQEFLKRQMLWTRLYHPDFAGVLMHALATAGLTLLVIGLLVASIVTGHWFVAMWILASTLVYLAIMIILLRRIEHAVWTVVRRRDRDQCSQVKERLGLWTLLLAIPLTQIVYVGATLWASVAHQVTWRGVRYMLQSPFEVTLVQDDLSAPSTSGKIESL